MADLSGYSTEQLEQMLQQTQPAPKGGRGDLSKMSEEELVAAAGRKPSEREILRAQGRQRFQAPPTGEMIEVPQYDATGAFIGTTMVPKPGSGDAFGYGVMDITPFGKDIAAAARTGSLAQAAKNIPSVLENVPIFGLGVKGARALGEAFEPYGSGRTQAQEREIIAGEAEAAQQASPGAYMLGQAAGIVPQLYLPMGLAARGATTVGKIGYGALEGAGYSAVTGLGEGITAEERLGEAGKGGVLGGVLGGALGRFAGPRAPRAAAEVPESVQAAERLGIDLPLYAVTESMPLQRGTALSRNVPLAGEPIIKAREAATLQLENVIDTLVPRMTKEQSGAAIGAKLKDWMTNLTRRDADKAYTEVRSLMDNPDAMLPLNNTRGAVADIMARRAGAKMEGLPAYIDTLMPALTSREGLTFQGAKDLLTELRTFSAANKISKTVDEAQVDKVYKALRKDVLDIAEAAGGEPARLFLQRADREYAAAMKMREELQKITGVRGERSDEQIFGKLFNAAREGGSADNKLLERAIRVMDPETIKAFQGGLLAQLGRDAQGQFSADRWLGKQGWSGLSDRAKAMIFKDQKEMRRTLDDVTSVAERFKNLNKFGNPSGTGQTVLGGLSVAGLVSNPISTMSMLIGGNAFSRIMSKPATAKTYLNWMQRYEDFVRRPTVATGRLAYQAGIPLSRVMSAEAGKEVDLNAYLNAQGAR